MLNIEFETFHLENGLKVIVHEDHSVPKVVLNILYHVGAKDEEPHRTGFAHLFEHLMFEGSINIPHYDKPLQSVGGYNNAFTTSDITNYYAGLPSNQIETAFWLESDRMLELAFSEEKLQVQKSVVIEEYKQRYLNQPYGDAHIHLRKLHFHTHPYQWPVIGKEIPHIENATLQDVKDFFFGFYAPNNATMVVAGDITTNEVKELAEKWFGPIPKRSLKKHDIPQEPALGTSREVEIKGEIPFPAVYKMYRIPALTDPSYYVADLLTDLLSNGKSAILFQHMVKKRAISPKVAAYSLGLHDPGAIVIEGKIGANKQIADFEEGLTEAYNQLYHIDEGELERIKQKLAATFVMQKISIQNRAISIAISDSLGNPDLINQTTEIYQEITLDEVRNAVNTYLSPDNCTTLYYIPQN